MKIKDYYLFKKSKREINSSKLLQYPRWLPITHHQNITLLESNIKDSSIYKWIKFAVKTNFKYIGCPEVLYDLRQ